MYCTARPNASNAEADELLLCIIAATGLLIAVMCGLATRNLLQMSKHITDHNRLAMEHLKEIEWTLNLVREKVNRF